VINYSLKIKVAIRKRELTVWILPVEGDVVEGEMGLVEHLVPAGSKAMLFRTAFDSRGRGADGFTEHLA
jgi:hypothetical protein